jgi:hypothetical protein
MAGMAYYAWATGAIVMIWETDQSMMTSAIAVLLVGTMVSLGIKCWAIDHVAEFEARVMAKHPDAKAVSQLDGADSGHLAERLAVMAGFVGTAIGLSMQAKALAGGSTSFVALATSLFTTASGGTAAGLIAIMTFNLETGIKRVRR